MMHAATIRKQPRMEPHQCRVRHGAVEFVQRGTHYLYGIVPYELEGRVITLLVNPEAPDVAYATAKRLPVQLIKPVFHCQ